MALYLNGESKQIFLNGVAYYLNLATCSSIVNDVTLLSSGGYVLKDSNGLYIITSPKSGDIVEAPTLSSDGYILKDSNGIYLSNKESE